jgi:hypothetical protein
MHVSRPAPDVTALTDAAEIPGQGVLPVNANGRDAAQPMLVDTGKPATRTEHHDAGWATRWTSGGSRRSSRRPSCACGRR